MTYWIALYLVLGFLFGLEYKRMPLFFKLVWGFTYPFFWPFAAAGGEIVMKAMGVLVGLGALVFAALVFSAVFESVAKESIGWALVVAASFAYAAYTTWK